MKTNESNQDIPKINMDELKNRVDFEEICNHLIDSLYITDGKGTTLYVNQKYLELGDLSAEEVLGTNIFEEKKEHSLYTNGVLPEVIETGMPAESIGTLLKTNKKIHITGLPIYDKEGKVKYAVALQKDLARLEELRQNLAQLRIANDKDSAELEYLRQKQMGDIEIVTESDNMKEAFTTVSAVAATDVTVLITGESGTGKEVLCDAIYKSSNRNGKPFIKINCSAIPENLLESELFGYEKGAFTGADEKGKAGLMEIANGGILLLDEIGDMPVDLQAKMLRVLQDKEITRIGGKNPIKLDVRLIAATNKDLQEEIKNGNFREDLYYRLNVVPIHILPLKERKADLGPLMERFLQNYNAKYDKKVSMTTGAIQMLHEYEWPGNIRELKNVIERMVVVNTSEIIDVDLVKNILHVDNSIAEVISDDSNTLKAAVEDLEIRIITNALAKHKSKRKAAEALGIDHSTLVKKCQRYGI